VKGRVTGEQGSMVDRQSVGPEAPVGLAMHWGVGEDRVKVARVNLEDLHSLIRHRLTVMLFPAVTSPCRAPLN
jgi:hypothetical protein